MNWLPLGRLVSPQAAGPQMPEHQEYRKQHDTVSTGCRLFIWEVIPGNKSKEVGGVKWKENKLLKQGPPSTGAHLRKMPPLMVPT